MSLRVPEGTASDPATGDCFTKCTKRITSLLCGSADVNGGQIMADWNCFLQSSNLCLSSYHLLILAAHERFLRSQLESFNEALVQGEQDAINASEMCAPGPDLLQSSSKSSNDKVCDRVAASSWAPTTSSTRERAESAACSSSGAGTAVARSWNAVLKAASDGARSVDADDSADNRGSSVPSHNTMDNQTSKLKECLGFGRASASSQSKPKRFLNWFRNPWHPHSNLVTTLGTGPFLHQHVHSDDARDLTEGAESENTTEEQSTAGDQQEPERPAGEEHSTSFIWSGFPDYIRGSPDGHSTGSSVQSWDTEDSSVVDDSDWEMQEDENTSAEEEVPLLEQQESSGPPSPTSLVTLSVHSGNQSWRTYSSDEAEEKHLLTAGAPYLMTAANVITALACPVCFTYMQTPILLCINGHNVCGRCHRRIYTCPVCRGPLLSTRNLALEAISADLAFKVKGVREGPKSVEGDALLAQDNSWETEDEADQQLEESEAQDCCILEVINSEDVEHVVS